MGLFEKLGLVETLNEGMGDFYQSEEAEEFVEPISVNIPEENNETLVLDIYHENEMGDMSQSIFKVDELINSLPKEMPTASKLASVKSILSNFGIGSDTVLKDAEKREEILNAALSGIVDKMQKEILDKDQEIESYKERISALEKEIAQLNAVMDNSKHLIECELERVERLREFIQGKG